MGRGDSLARQLQLIQLLDDRRALVEPDVAAVLGYTVRTVYRDLQVLERVGVPIYQERHGRQARWRVVDGYRRKLTLTLSLPELLALSTGRELLAWLSGTLFHEAAISALEKIQAALPPDLATRAKATGRRFTTRLPCAPGTSPRLVRRELWAPRDPPATHVTPPGYGRLRSTGRAASADAKGAA